MSWRSKLVGVAILAGLVTALASDGPADKQSQPDGATRATSGLFHPDPEHLWNRLHRHFTVRTTPSGQEYGFDALDPLLWPNTQYLVTGKSHEKALQLCDEFLRVRGEQLIADPRKRALLQRDLWGVFDWLADPDAQFYVTDTHLAARAALRAKLGPILWRLALPQEKVRALADNYRQAIASRRYPAEYDQSLRESPFLPPDLLDTQGPWVRLTPYQGPTAPSHVSAFSGRSVFHVFLRLSGGRKATLEYLERLWRFPRPWVESPHAPGTFCCLSRLNPEVPQFPPGTQVALVRRMVLFDANGKLIDTPVTESVQIRVYREVPVGGLTAASMQAQAFFEFKLSRELLLTGEAGGLRAVTSEDKEFPIFGTHGFDPFEPISGELRGDALPCMACHAEHGIHSLRTVEALFPPNPLTRDPLEGEPGYGVPHLEASADLNWKATRYDWGLLNALRPLPNNPQNR